MRPKDIIKFLRMIIHCPEAPPIYIWGPPGVGKSAVTNQVTKEEKIGFIDLRLVLMDPTDLRGIPIPENGKARWLPPSALPTEGEGILFLDELNLAPPLVQSSAYQLVLDKKIGEYQLPKGWRIIAAGNKAEHGANVYKMAPALRSRFTHIDFEINVDDWRQWAIQSEVVSEVIEFISFRPDLLFQFDPKRHENAFPNPRAWGEFVSPIFKNRNLLGEEITHQAIGGAVSVGAAAEFKAYLRLKNELPSIDEILEGKDLVPEKIDLACALVTALATRAKPAQFNRLLEYSEKLTAEVAILMAKLMLSKNKEELIRCQNWNAWAKKHSEFIL